MRMKYAHREVVAINFRYPKPHTMLAIPIEEKEIEQWQEKVSGERLAKR